MWHRDSPLAVSSQSWGWKSLGGTETEGDLAESELLFPPSDSLDHFFSGSSLCIQPHTEIQLILK